MPAFFGLLFGLRARVGRRPYLVYGFALAKGGEFRLVPPSNGRTRLEGTTHYTLANYPELYSVVYAEALLHGIHGRVLEHIKNLSER